ncbi:MAG: glycosyl hydrolase [Acidobacteria bacterium]|uniref:Glycosyl hydrolase n=1 Tax=Candidatus Polarisedimenticola svalbardensis TaxID=2886004 RepID=A0A8J6Y0T6_9BACT|nr:glycosyl hydrolase [Candidatus Polarisedimenticola svalbardensis]
MKKLCTLILITLVLAAVPAMAKKKAAGGSKADEGPWTASTFSGLALRNIGPALTSGRIADFAVDPRNRKRFFVAVASGGVWKTENAGTTWTPVFDKEGSYSIGDVTLDPNDPLVVWVGTGENNSQRSVGYGDGVYKSVDGGKTWAHMGLKDSEHIGNIVVDPRNSDRVFVAAHGPLWRSGGDRGLYLTEDGGKTWTNALAISEHTGINEVVIDPRNPDVMYASSYQRRRHVWVLINGGPEGALYKSKDGGKSWNKLENGLPKGDIGRVGLAVSPAAPDTVYAIVEAAGKESGFYRSVDAGASWEKRSDYVAGSPQYYNEIIADPAKEDRVYSMDTWMHVTEDGGKTFHKVGEITKHVDNHALWIDPADTDYLLAGCDGGVYETFDRGATWVFKANLPVTQFYRATPDNDAPFYNVYGGTQDNATLGGPSQTATVHGITNQDWFVTIFGDGYKTVIDPTDADVLYSQYQYGGLARFDRKSGELVDIQPQPAPGEDGSRWNWDSPVIISPHANTRLYFASQRLYRSDDRGNSWKPVSGDLSSGVDRNKLKVMGRVWSVDAVAKNASTSFYGNIVALNESTLVEGLIYVGTDDGLVQVTEDGGKSWSRVDDIAGVPADAYVYDLEPSLHDDAVVFGSFNNHKKGDFKPYLMKSGDRGMTWNSITANLPERGSTYAFAQDSVNPGLLFVGTEFGLFFTVDGGKVWTGLTGGMPTVAVRDLEIQRRENDLVVGSFGRGILILDDYTPLRTIDEEALKTGSTLFPVKDAWMYIPAVPMGIRGKAFQGDGFFTAPNPPYGAVFTYYLAEEIETLKKTRQESETKVKAGSGDVFYPSWDDLRAEDREEEPVIILTVKDEEGGIVRRVEGPVTAGFHRVAWDFRYPASEPVDLTPDDPGPFGNPDRGPMAAPGSYTVSLAKRVRGEVTDLSEPTSFKATPLGTALLPAEDREELLAFQMKTGRLNRAVLGANRSLSEAMNRIKHLKKGIDDTPGATGELAARVRQLEVEIRDLQILLTGDGTISRRSEPTPPSITDRVQRIIQAQWDSTSAPTATSRDGYRFAAQAFAPVLADLTRLVETDLAGLEQDLESAGGPWTPGRVPRWTLE